MPDNTPTAIGQDLGAEIDLMIKASGPMSLSTYMRLCLTHPTLGYYKRTQPLGRGGDFITAPDVSQMFGEMIGLFALLMRRQLPQGPVELVELGPGRGTMLSDALRAIQGMGEPLEGLSVTLAETSPVLRAEQESRLGAFGPRWIGELEELDKDGPPLIVLANEFFDVLPIKQYQKQRNAWHERVIGLEKGKRRFGLDPNPVPTESMPAGIGSAEDGEIFESSTIAADIMADLSDALVRRGGVLLAIDYGYAATRTGDTFQAVSGHAYADPLEAPGTADLTAHVDFAALAEAARQRGAVAHPLLTQTAFLGAMGIAERAKALISANPDLAESLGQDVARLVGEDQMGTLFKALCVTAPGLAPYPFAPLQDAAR